MNKLLRKLDLTAIAYVAAMAVLLSTMFFLLAPVPTSGFSGDGDGDGDGGGGGGGGSPITYIEANIKQIEVKALNTEICRRIPWIQNGNLTVGFDMSKCVGVAYYIKLDSGITVSFARTDSMSLSEFYNQIRGSGFTGEMSMMMQIINKIGKTVGVYVIAHTATGFTINGEAGDKPKYGNDFDKFDKLGDYPDDYDFDIDDLYDYFGDGNFTGNTQELLKELIKLLERLEELKKKLEELKKKNEGAKPWCNAGVWKRDLSLGDEGEDVRMLQKFLNSQPGIKIAESGPGSPGFESTFFGHGTERALIKFQEMHVAELLRPIGEEKGTGYFGAITQAFIAKEFCKAVDDKVTSFRLSDVAKVTVQVFDANDNEYRTYTITLKSGKVLQVSINERMSKLAITDAFRKVGYTGNVDDLMDLADEGGPVTSSFGLNDVAKVTVQGVDSHNDSFQLYTITLKNGIVLTVMVKVGASTSAVRDAFRKVGYTGNINDLRNMAEDADATFTLSDIKSVTREYVDPSALMADEEYSIYTITLKNGRVIEFRVPAFTIQGALEAELRNAGYVGNIDDFVSIVKTIESDNDFGLGVTAVKLKVYVTFDLPNGCTGYVIKWGDGKVDTKVGNNNDVCTQVYSSVTLDHTYDKSGTYEVEVTRTSGTQKQVAKRKITVTQ